MKKTILKIAAVLAVLLILVVVGIGYFLDSIIKSSIETVGPKIAKVEVKLDAVSLSVLSGSGKIKGLLVGNPEGFKTTSAIQVGRASLAIQPKSLLSDKIVVRSIHVESPEITFEGTLNGNNLSKILENIEAATAGEKNAPGTSDRKSQKKIEVDDFSITGGKIHLSMTMLGSSRSATLPLPDIHLQDLGKSSEGITATELSQTIFKVLLDSATKAVAGAMTHLSKDATNAAQDVGKTATGEVGKTSKKIGDLFKKK
jgi:uncharacterized protein involved in outer membrane biogenesis